MYTLQVVLKKLNIFNCPWFSCRGCLLLKLCKCNKNLNSEK